MCRFTNFVYGHHCLNWNSLKWRRGKDMPWPTWYYLGSCSRAILYSFNPASKDWVTPYTNTCISSWKDSSPLLGVGAQDNMSAVPQLARNMVYCKIQSGHTVKSKQCRMVTCRDVYRVQQWNEWLVIQLNCEFLAKDVIWKLLACLCDDHSLLFNLQGN